MIIHDGNLNAFDSDAKINRIIDRLNDLALSDKNYVFRGYSKQDELKPGIIRRTDYKDRERD